MGGLKLCDTPQKFINNSIIVSSQITKIQIYNYHDTQFLDIEKHSPRQYDIISKYLMITNFHLNDAPKGMKSLPLFE